MRRLLWFGLFTAACGGSAAQDAGSTDAGLMDAGSPDASSPDAGSTDASSTDASSPDAASMDAGPDADSIGVLTLNLRCLSVEDTPYPSNAERFAAIASVVAEERVDVLLLQEVCDDGRVNAITLLQGALEAAGAGTFEAHVVFAHRAWEGTPEAADESVAVLARTLSDRRTLVHRDQAGLLRVAASASVATTLGPLHVVAVHFENRDAPARRSQAREAAVVALSESDPSLAIVVGGDLNARARSDAYQAFLEQGYVDGSASAGGSRIDHIFFHRGAPLAASETRRLFVADRVSDHPGVLVRLVASPPATVTVTRIVAAHDPGPDRYLSVRGDTAPLSWDLGWPMHDLGAGRWRLVSTELAGTIELKALIDDTAWQTGPNERTSAGVDLRFTPSF